MPELETKKNEIVFVGKTTKQIVALVSDLYAANNLSVKMETTFIDFLINDDNRLKKAVQANPESLYNSVLQAASMGVSFNPQFKEVYFVPYNMNKYNEETKKNDIVPTVTVSTMWRGKKKVLVNCGAVKDIDTELVYEGEHFEVEVIDGQRKITHKPNYFKRGDNSKIIGGYATATLPDGSTKTFPPKGRDYFDRCMKASQDKMKGVTSPAWKNWFDEQCRKCLINAADGQITKTGVNPDLLAIITEAETKDIDYVDVTEQKALEPEKPEIKEFNEGEFEELIRQLNHFEISKEMAKKKYLGYNFSDEQKKEYVDACTITDEKINEIIGIVADQSKTIQDFQFILTPEQCELVTNAVIDKNMSNGEAN